MSLYQRKDSSVWWLKIHHGGKVIQKSTGTADKLKAQELHDRLKVELWEQERLGVKPRHSWQEAVVRWLAESSGKATHKEDVSKLKWLHPYLGHLVLDEITLDVVGQVKMEKLKEAGPSTVNRYLALIRSILIRAKDEWEWLDKIPKIKLFKEPEGRERSITPDQANRLLSELPGHQQDMVLFALHTGLRQSNVVKLEWSCVDLDRSHAWVKAGNSKNRKAIAVPLNDYAMGILLKQLGKHPQRVFTFRGNPVANANTRAWREALKRVGIVDFRWHDLRHTWATWHRQVGTPTHELQSLGGWKTPAMVERYAHLAPDCRSQAASRLESLGVGYDLATYGNDKGLVQ